MGCLHWKVTRCESRGRGTVLIYEGESVEQCGKERVSFHFVIRSDIFVADILAETTGGFRFIEFLKGKFGDPEEDPLSIFHGEFGDGISLWGRGTPAVAAMGHLLVEGAARAGIANFSATIDMADIALSCNAIDLNGENINATPFAFNDAGGNVCACGEQEPEACVVLSSMLLPPEAADVGG